MFTGIVRAMGSVVELRRQPSGARLIVHLGDLACDSLRVGDSIAVNGACLTVGELAQGNATFGISEETLARCLVGEWRTGTRVNLETALTLQTPLGGHLVSGHIDESGSVSEFARVGDCVRLGIRGSKPFGSFVAPKGSVAVDGVSLTVNTVQDTGDAVAFSAMLVPQTLERTTLGDLATGARVHLEADLLARYALRAVQVEARA